MTHGLLDELRRETKIPVTAPRLAPEKKWEALKWLFHCREKQRFPPGRVGGRCFFSFGGARCGLKITGK